MSDWMGEVADLFRPLADRLEARILAAYIDQMDATGVKVLDPMSPENIERGSTEYPGGIITVIDSDCLLELCARCGNKLDSEILKNILLVLKPR